MTIPDFLDHIASLNMSLTVSGDQLVLKAKANYPSPGSVKIGDDSIASYIRSNKASLMKHLSATKVDQGEAEESTYPLSPLQAGMLFHNVYDEQSAAYRHQFRCDFIGLDEATFIDCWRYLLRNHTILRTSFHYGDSQVPLQRVHDHVEMPRTIYDSRQYSSEFIEGIEANEYNTPFDFSNAPLMRVVLIKISDQKTRMILTYHHIISDGWSLPILMEEFLRTYESLLSGKTPDNQVEDRYGDYIRYVKKKERSSESYWREYLTGFRKPTLFPFISSTSKRTKSVEEFKEEVLLLDEKLTRSLVSFSRQNKITVNTFFQGAWLYLLSAYTGEVDVSFGGVVSGRPEDLPDIERRVGLYINTLPVRYHIADDQRIDQWLQSLQLDQGRSRTHQYSSLADVQRWSELSGGLFDSIMVFQNYPVSKVLGSNSCSLKAENVSGIEQSSNYPLLIRISNNDGFLVQFIYKKSMVDTFYVQQIKHHFGFLVETILADPARKIGDIEICRPSEQQYLLNQCNGPAVEIKNKTLIQSFGASVLKFPDKVAVVSGTRRITFSELEEKSNQVANYLMRRGIRAGDLVPISVDPAEGLIVGIISILKCGAAYVPIDPGCPGERLAFILAEIEAKLFVVNDFVKDWSFSSIEKVDLKCNDREISGENRILDSSPLISSENLAYVIYTSGTTGQPKGVMVDHGSISTYIDNQTSQFRVGPDEVILQLAHCSFDASVEQIFIALCNGATLVLVPENIKHDGMLFKEFLNTHKITHLHATPSYLRTIADGDFPYLKRVVSAGEPCSKDLADRWHTRSDFYNKYGPTEATISVAQYRFRSVDDLSSCLSVPIGRALPNNILLVLDGKMRPVPVGVVGELYIGGRQLAKGYLKNPQLTAEKFIISPFNRGTKLYRTGDLVKCLPTGNLEFIGRADDQVKIRGHRVELREVERALSGAPGVRECAVIVHKDATESSRLVAYVVCGTEFNKENILNHITRWLPSFMLPSLILPVTALPLNTSGKIDRSTLVKNFSLPRPEATSKAPESEIEAAIARTWGELLNVEHVGVMDNFFELGGDSIISIQVVSRLRKYGYDVRIDDLFTHQTVSGVYRAIVERQEQAIDNVPKVNDPPRELTYGDSRYYKLDGVSEEDLMKFLDQPLMGGLKRRDSIVSCYKLSPLQAGMLFHSLFDKQGNTYRNQLVCDLYDVDLSIFRSTWDHLIKNHTILRTSFHYDVFPVPVQCVHHNINLPVEIVDYTHLSNVSKPLALQLIQEEDRKKGFDFASPPLMRVVLIRLDAVHYRMLWSSHHLLHDGWSLPLMIEEFLCTYDELFKGRSAPEVPEDRYEDYILHIEKRDKDEESKYWQTYLDGFSVGTKLPFVQSPNGGTKATGEFSETLLVLDEYFVAKMSSYCRGNHLTMNTVMQGVWAFLMHKYTNSDDVTFGVVNSGRPEDLLGVEKRVGMYINTLPLRSVFTDSINITDWLKSLQADQFKSRNHQYVSLLDIQKWTGINGDLFDTTVAFQNFPVSKVISDRKWSLVVDNLLVNEQSNYPLYLTIGLFENVNVHFFFNKNMIDPVYVEEIKAHFRNVLTQIINGECKEVRDLRLVDQSRRADFVNFSKGRSAKYKRETVIDMFNDQCKAATDNIALIFDNISLSYRELNERSNQLARYMQTFGVGMGDIVPIGTSNPLNMVVGILAIMKSGAAYVPVDRSYPAERIRYLLADISAKLLIVDAPLHHEITGDIAVIDLSNDASKISSLLVEEIPIVLDTQSLAYIIYTSGSTGGPKGVMVEHGSLANYLLSCAGKYIGGETNSGSYAQLSFAFDASITSVLLPLVAGKKVVLADPSSPKIFSEAAFWDNAPYDFIKLTPGQLEILAACELTDKLLFARRIVIGGEQLLKDQLQFLKHYPWDIEIINEYGPTEATVGCCNYSVSNKSEWINGKEAVPIGRPTENVELYILDGRMEPVPFGVIGEIWIGGVQVARGYFQKPRLTEEKFVYNPFGEGRLYRTGDLARRLPDGNLEFVGRKDDQVKIRGYRIELGEIEHWLRQFVQVKEAKVLVNQRGNHKMLQAFVVFHTQNPTIKTDAQSDIDVDSGMKLREQLLAKVPHYLVPNQIFVLKRFPLTPRGKVDTDRLLSLTSEAYSVDSTQPTAPLEESLLKIWKDLLKVDHISINDDFFLVGGDSLLAIRLISSIRKELAVDIPISTFFELATVKKLSSFIEERIPAFSDNELTTIRL
jgi:amino acid adenylation domain-containing protein